MARSIFVCARRTNLPRVLAGLLGLAGLNNFVMAEAASGQMVQPGPAAEPADLLSREHATGNWFGLRDKLKEHGLSIDLQSYIDYSHNFHGGIKSGDALRHLLNVDVVVETEPLLGFKGGTFFLGFQTHSGRHGSEKLTGDIQGFDNIDYDDFTQISELWYEQKLIDDKLRVKLGKLDANTEFAFVEYGGEFIHSSPGFSPTILSFPSYPDPATAVLVFVEPGESWYIGGAVFDGATQDGGRGRTGNRGPSTFWGEPSDLFLIAETGFRWSVGNGALPGRAGIGAWRHTGTFDRFDGGREDGAAGFYAVLDQLLWRENPGDKADGQGIGLFAQYGWADEEISAIVHHIGAGVAWAGAIPTREDDVCGLMVSYAGLSGESGADIAEKYELSIGAFYKLQVTRWFSVKPDLQYIVNPGGSSDGNALAFTLRAEIAF